MKTQNAVIQQQFNQQAEHYLTSTTHSQGEDLKELETFLREQIAQTEPDRLANQFKVLDLGCGAGHVSFTSAKTECSVIAMDMSQKMLDIVEQESQKRQLNNIKTQSGKAESIPFADSTFDCVISRFSAHHWQDLPKAMAEVKRVLKPNGYFVMIDIIASEIPLFDTVLQAIELLRDSSHVRDYRLSEWQNYFSQQRLELQSVKTWNLPMQFDDWVKRSATPNAEVEMISSMLQKSASEVKDFFNVNAKSDFQLRSAMMITKKE